MEVRRLLLDGCAYSAFTRKHGEIERALRRAGKPIPTNDIWIAASAMQHGLVVLTTDEHFDHIPQVRVMRSES